MQEDKETEYLDGSSFRNFVEGEIINDFNYSISTLRNLLAEEPDKDMMQVIACIYLELVEIIHRAFRNSYDLEVDELYECFMHFHFMDKCIRYNPFGAPLKEVVVAEAMNYIKIGQIFCQISGFHTIVPMFDYYRAELERIRGRIWQSIRFYNLAMINLKNKHQDDFIQEIRSRLGTLYSDGLVKSPLCAHKSQEALLRIKSAGIKMQNSVN